MVRRPRVEIEGGLFHVYNRVASGEPIFSDPNEAVEFIEILRDTKMRDGWTLLAWCVMANHYHLVLRTGTVPLWRGMHTVQNLYSRRFNKRHRRTGSLWQSRYMAKYVEDESYLGRLVIYVHLNPVAAGVVENVDQYVFGGHREIKKLLRSSLVDIDETMLCFGTQKNEARRSYLSAMSAGTAEDSAENRGLRWHPFGVSDDEDLETDRARPTIDFLGRSTGPERPQLDAGVFLGLVCKILEVDKNHVCSRRRSRTVARTRRLIVTLGVERWRQNRTKLAVVLRKNPDVLSWWAAEGATLRLEDPDFAETFDRADEKLSLRAVKLSASERMGITS